MSEAQTEEPQAARETYTGKTERVTHPTLVLNYLRRLYDSRRFLTVAIEGNPTPYTSMLLEIDSDKGLAVLDQLNPAGGNKQIVAARKFRASANHEGIEIMFNGEINAIVGKAPQQAFRFPLPKELFYIQRRSSYRAPIGMAESVDVYLSDVKERISEGKLINVSVGGFAADIKVHKYSELQKGTTIPTCQFSIPGSISVVNKAEVRFIKMDPETRKARIGARFVDLGGREERAIQRWVMLLERELIKKGAEP